MAGQARPRSFLDRGRVLSIAGIAVFDVIGPLVVYYWLRSAGQSAVVALVVSGTVPALGIALGVIRHRRLDAIGVLVLFGITVGVVVGLVTRNAHLVLLDGTVPTAVFGLVCLSSLWWDRPLMYRFALESMGADTPKGRDFADRWQYASFRHVFRVMTTVWGVAFLAEAAAQSVIIETASTGVAKATSNVMPLAVVAVIVTWQVFYGRHWKRIGDLAAQAARAGGS
jgi:hypothetical protein